MSEPYPPLLPWKLAALALLLLAALTGWRLEWDPFQSARDESDVLRGMHARVGSGPALLVIGNSRLAQPVKVDEAYHELLSSAGLEDHAPLLVDGADLHVSTLERWSARITAMRPTLLVVQLDLFAPTDRSVAPDQVVPNLLTFERSGATIPRVLALFEGLEGCERRFAVEVPHPQGVLAALGPAWRRDRDLLAERVTAAGYPVLRDAQGWPDALYTDQRHLGPTGAARFRAWLGAALRRALRAG